MLWKHLEHCKNTDFFVTLLFNHQMDCIYFSLCSQLLFYISWICSLYFELRLLHWFSAEDGRLYTLNIVAKLLHQDRSLGR